MAVNVQSATSAIRLRGVRVHNLRDLDVDIPRDSLVVLTGVSGSGKSSLAFDTLHAEGRRRYIEGLSSYARQFLDQMERPDVDLIDGLPPTVAIDQKSGSANPRSTVATVTEAYDYLRLLYARTGEPHCPDCDQPIRRQAPEQVVDTVMGFPEGTKVLVLAPLVRSRKGQHLDVFRTIREARLMRARVDGVVVEIDAEPPKLAKTKPHDIEAVVDRLVVREGTRARIAESIDAALKLGDGTIVLSVQEGDHWVDRIASTRYSCTNCNTGLAEIEPRTFSFNSPLGACSACGGLGSFRKFDPDLVAPDRNKSLDDGVVLPFENSKTERSAFLSDPGLGSFLKRHKLTRSIPLIDWPAAVLASFFRARSEYTSAFWPSLSRDLLTPRPRHGDPHWTRSDRKLSAWRVREPASGPRPGMSGWEVERSMNSPPCPSTWRGIFWLRFVFEAALDRVGPPLVAEVDVRLAFLAKVGLNYLTLARSADTLSGGELQRVRLATQIGSGLVGVCYVLDEPTTGLHPRDTARLLESLTELRDRGNSVVVVEHDEATIRAADWLIDLGPGAGLDGGRIVAQGPPMALVESGESATARYLRGEPPAPLGSSGRLARTPGSIVIRGATEHNLKRVTASIPLGTLTCVTGVSGSGKSSLVLDILARSARRRLEQVGPRPGTHEVIEGLDAIDKLIAIDQGPIGRGPRSTPATFTGVFDEIRKVFVKTREAKVRGYAASRFSFNVKGGRCETCLGQGVRKVEMNFLPDLYVRCEACEGFRFNPQTLDCRFKGRNIGEVLQLRVDDAVELFENVPKVARGLEALREAGLGYVALGQSSTTLSGGEAQRVKLAAELGRVATGRTLYILDEPTTGLHFSDVAALLVILHRLADLGNTVVVIEHNLDVIRTADWIVDLGPEGGDKGGQIMAEGPPGLIAASPASETGKWI